MDNIRVGQIRIDPNDGEKIEIVDGGYVVLYNRNKGSRRIGVRFNASYEFVERVFSKIDETSVITEILKRYEGRR